MFKVFSRRNQAPAPRSRAAFAQAAFVLACFACAASPASAKCALAPPGGYGVLVSGYDTSTLATKFLTGVISIDAHCTITGEVTGGFGGATTSSSVTGTYAVNSDGTGTITLNLANDPVIETFAVSLTHVQNGAIGLESDASAAATITVTRQVTAPPYDLTSIAGVFAASCYSAFGSDLNLLTFDGVGNVTGVDVSGINGIQTTNSVGGSYMMNADGSFVISLTNGAVMNGVISNVNKLISYSYIPPGATDAVGCIGHRQSGTKS